MAGLDDEFDVAGGEARRGEAKHEYLEAVKVFQAEEERVSVRRKGDGKKVLALKRNRRHVLLTDLMLIRLDSCDALSPYPRKSTRAGQAVKKAAAVTPSPRQRPISDWQASRPATTGRSNLSISTYLCLASVSFQKAVIEAQARVTFNCCGIVFKYRWETRLGVDAKLPTVQKLQGLAL